MFTVSKILHRWDEAASKIHPKIIPKLINKLSNKKQTKSFQNCGCEPTSPKSSNENSPGLRPTACQVVSTQSFKQIKPFLLLVGGTQADKLGLPMIGGPTSSLLFRCSFFHSFSNLFFSTKSRPKDDLGSILASILGTFSLFFHDF